MGSSNNAADLVGYARQDGVGFDTPAPYNSHTDIVVAVRDGEIDVIGGNVSDSVTLKTLQIDDQGRLTDSSEDWFVVLSNQLSDGITITPDDSDTPAYPGYLLRYEPGESLSYDSNVELWQQRMQDLGFEIEVDGLYGSQSEAVARQFQQATDLEVDGIVGPETWETSFSVDSVEIPPDDPTIPLPEDVTPDPLYPDYSGEIAVNDDFSPNVRAFLDTIAYAEGTYDPEGYRIMFGGDRFDNFDVHPNVCVPFSDTCSTAAGRYQFLNRTWDSLASDLSLSDFSPENQDIAAVQLIQGEGAFDDIEANRFEEAAGKVANIWASFPGAGYGQPEKDLQELKQFYEARQSQYV